MDVPATLAPRELHDPVVGPLPCRQCGAWVEVCRCGAVISLASEVLHDCEPYLQAGGYRDPEPPRLSWEERQLSRIGGIVIPVVLVFALLFLVALVAAYTPWPWR